MASRGSVAKPRAKNGSIEVNRFVAKRTKSGTTTIDASGPVAWVAASVVTVGGVLILYSLFNPGHAAAVGWGLGIGAGIFWSGMGVWLYRRHSSGGHGT